MREDWSENDVEVMLQSAGEDLLLGLVELIVLATGDGHPDTVPEVGGDRVVGGWVGGGW